MNHSIKKMLRITDKHLEITDISYETLKDKQHLVIEATLSPPPHACKNCGSSVTDGERNTIIVKNGKKKTWIRFDEFNHLPMVMRLKKQRYTCKNCHSHWTAQSYLVAPRHSIANHVKYKIIALLAEKVSLTFIAKFCHVSLSTVIRLLKELACYLPNHSKRLLPKVLMVDEFRSHTSMEDRMNFICADGTDGKLVDVLPTSKLPQLTSYFEKCINPEEVNYLVTDMNAAYFQLTKKVFPNAKLVIDRFHIVKHMNQTFQDFRIRSMKKLIDTGHKAEAQKLKTNWRYLTKDRQTINHSDYKSWRSFRLPRYPYLTEAMMIDRLLSCLPSLKEAYEAFHERQDAFRDKDHESFLPY